MCYPLCQFKNKFMKDTYWSWRKNKTTAKKSINVYVSNIIQETGWLSELHWYLAHNSDTWTKRNNLYQNNVFDFLCVHVETMTYVIFHTIKKKFKMNKTCKSKEIVMRSVLCMDLSIQKQQQNQSKAKYITIN